jgi:hypothetical protein
MLIWKAILALSTFGLIFISYQFGWLDWIKDWRKVLQYSKWYAIACGIGLNIYWLYLIVTNA